VNNPVTIQERLIMKKCIFVILALALLSLAACSSVTRPMAITDNPAGAKTGEATATVLLIPYGGYIVLSGDASLSTAAANGGVTKIAVVDQRIEKGVFVSKVTTIVTGE
jgi:hypothetical protein